MRMVEDFPDLARIDPDRFGGWEIGLAGYRKVREKKLDTIFPDELPVAIELTNKQAGLIVFVSESSLGGKIHLDIDSEGRLSGERENYYLPKGLWNGLDAVVRAYEVAGEGTKYAAVFTVPLPLDNRTDEPLYYTRYRLRTRYYRSVGLKPGEVEVVDLRE